MEVLRLDTFILGIFIAIGIYTGLIMLLKLLHDKGLL